MEEIKDSVVEQEMKSEYEIIGIRFKNVGKVYYFDPCGINLAPGDKAVVETARGVEYGFVTVDKPDEKADGNTRKVYLWNGFSTLVPLITPFEI